MEPRLAAPAIDLRPLRAAMKRMSIPTRRIRRNFESRIVRGGGLYGREFWRSIGGARVGGFLGFITRVNGWEHLDVRPPEAVVLAFVRPADGPLHRRLVARKDSLFRKVARQSQYEGAPFRFLPEREEALVRHLSMRGRPDEILVLSACDFLMTSFRAFWAADYLEKIRKLRAPSARRH